MASSTTTLITATSAFLHPRAQTTIPPQVIGYTSTFGVYSAWNCLTGTWYEVSGFGRCCPTTQGDCPVYTTCLQGSIVANDQFNYPCSGSFKQSECITGTVYESIGDLSPKYYVGCWPSWTGGDWKATRTLPITTTEDPATAATPTPPPTNLPVTSSSGNSSNGLSAAALAAMVIGIVFGLTLAIACGCLSSYWWTRRKKRRVEKEMREVELRIEASKLARTLSVQPMRPQSRLAELREMNEIVEVMGEYAPGGEDDFYVPGHWKRPSEADGREIGMEVRSPEVAMTSQHVRPEFRSFDFGQGTATQVSDGRTARSGSSANSHGSWRRSSNVERWERTSLSEVVDQEVPQPLKIYKTGRSYQNGRFGIIDAECVDTGRHSGSGEGSRNTTPKSNVDVLNTDEDSSSKGNSRLQGTGDIQESREEDDLAEDATLASRKQAVR